MMKKLLLLIMMATAISAVAQKKKAYKGKYTFQDLEKVPESPNYSSLDYWVAHPDKKDMADVVPGRGQLAEYQETADVDVFFVYPTIYSGKQNKEHPWFADVNDEKLNKQIANSTIKYQATVFNASGKVYSPLYRQAHLGIYYSELDLKVEALEYAYKDVKKAFEYYLEHWNNGRPIIIASHSQGTDHAVKLLHDFFEYDEAMKQKLVAAYIVGMPLNRNTFNEISPCTSPNQTGCWLTWNTYLKGYYPLDHEFWYGSAFNINPLTWQDDNEYASWGENRGGVLKNYKRIMPGLVDAQTVDGMLWIDKPRFFWKFLLSWKRYHRVDYNLYYINIRDNVEERVQSYLEKMKE